MANDPLLPPQALAAEMAVLGAMLIEADAVERAMDILGEQDFYHDVHRSVFHVMAELAGRSAAVDLVTVSEELRKRQKLDEVGGMAFLSELMHKVATAAHVEHYARIVKDKALLRKLIQSGTQIVQSSLEADGNAREMIDSAEKMIFDIGQSQIENKTVQIKDIVQSIHE